MLELLAKGGWVMYVLLACSVVALAIALERLYNLLRAQNDADKLIGAVKRHLNQGRFLEALKFAKQERGPIAAVLAAGIQNYGRDLNEVERNMNLVAEQELYRMRKRLPALQIIATISPLLGLLGTVTGEIKVFNVLGQLQGVSDPVAMSSGIAEALLTTAYGLIIAIPVSVIYSYLDSLVVKNVTSMNRAMAEILDIFANLKVETSEKETSDIA
ncbi:MAG: MotA/TolQ/ExbB proton channel family protein [Bacillota bacterium]|jgi:biopolymer transport protein ExbB|nr:MotA/TolQ/ExbB proton channel family protein [Bacillota bacterium]NLU54071.1 MotA/TolQ/ExbB proton channel family protein [Bacillota bacterium]HOA91568.1 MotA/TolQ/ExbB proton channel family protein [Bacillota bacterium]HPT61078.1 MotA/TolQ/ExbB proton channel family protein [Bacillota bacterium]HPZ73531.1 MotA/TolQ/ExbB proton channel family protein [Bacillota bacterium]